MSIKIIFLGNYSQDNKKFVKISYFFALIEKIIELYNYSLC